MDDETRGMIQDACRESDPLQAEFERDGWLRAQRTKQSAPVEIVRKTYVSRPAPQPPVTTMAPEVQKLWDAWFDTRVQKWVGHKSRLFNAIAEAFSLFREAERKHMHEHVINEIKKQLDAEATKLREEIAGVRIDTVVGRSVLRGEINDLMRKKVRT